jgi:peptidoglycan/LPS O-acetylase OafA/YrhL
VSSKAPKMIGSLTGLRAVAALMVVIYHFSEIGVHTYYDFGVLDTPVSLGFMGVDVFFVLSGFIMYYVYKDTFASAVRANDYGKFLRYRFARLYPVHIGTLLFMLVLYWVAGHWFEYTPVDASCYTPWSVANNVTLTHVWFPHVCAPNTPAWSISAEWFAYLLFPFACWALIRAPKWVGIVLLPVAAIGAQLLPSTNALFQIATEFTVGMAFAHLSATYGLSARLGKFGSLAAAAAFLASLYILQHRAPLVHATLAGIAIVALANPRDLGGRVLSLKVPVFLGEISYSIYMCHWIVWSTLRHAGPRFIPWLGVAPLALIGLALVTTLAVSTAAYYMIEVPGREYLRRRPVRALATPPESAPVS